MVFMQNMKKEKRFKSFNNYSVKNESKSISSSLQISFNCSYNLSSISIPFNSASATLLTSRSPGIATFSPVALT